MNVSTFILKKLQVADIVICVTVTGYTLLNMATSLSMTSLVAIGVTSALKSSARCCVNPYGWTRVIYRCASQNLRSSLYEHVREGYSHKPVLDMTRVCDDTDEVISELDKRKGDLRKEDVRDIVSTPTLANVVVHLYKLMSFLVAKHVI